MIVVAAPLRIEACALRRGSGALRVVRTGMGPARARRAAERLREERASALAVAGLCGALVPGILPGTVIAASSLIDESGRELALETGSLCAALEAAGLAPRVGALFSTGRLVRGAERARLAASGAIAVDMESAWLARGAGERPLAVVRVVVDAPGFELLRPAALPAALRALRVLRDVAQALERWQPLTLPGGH